MLALFLCVLWGVGWGGHVCTRIVSVLHLKDRFNGLFSYNTLCTCLQICLIFILEKF